MRIRDAIPDLPERVTIKDDPWPGLLFASMSSPFRSTVIVIAFYHKILHVRYLSSATYPTGAKSWRSVYCSSRSLILPGLVQSAVSAVLVERNLDTGCQPRLLEWFEQVAECGDMVLRVPGRHRSITANSFP